MPAGRACRVDANKGIRGALKTQKVAIVTTLVLSSVILRRHGWRPRRIQTAILSANRFSYAGRRTGTVYRDRYRIEERHRRAQLAPHLFNRVLRFLATHLVKLLAPGFVLLDPVFSKRPVLNLGQYLLHLRAGGIRNQARPGGVVAVLGGVGYGIAHVSQTTPVHKIDNQLQLMQAFEVGDLRLVTGVHQRLEAGLHQRAHAAAQHRLLAEEVSLRLFGKRSFDHSGSCAADRFGVGERQIVCLTGSVLLDRDQGRNAAAFREYFAHPVARSLWCDHAYINVFGGDDSAVTDVESVCEHQRLSLAHGRSNVFVVNCRLRRIGSEDHDDVGPLGGIGNGEHLEAGALGLLDGPAGGRQADAYIDARVLEIQRVGMSLGAIADNGYFFSLDQRKIGILVVISLGH